MNRRPRKHLVDPNRTPAQERAVFDLLRASAPSAPGVIIETGIGYDVIAEKLGITTRDVAVMVYRMRKRGIKIETYHVALARGEFK